MQIFEYFKKDLGPHLIDQALHFVGVLTCLLIFNRAQSVVDDWIDATILQYFWVASTSFFFEVKSGYVLKYKGSFFKTRGIIQEEGLKAANRSQIFLRLNRAYG
jgi:hypothetical protein